MSMRAASLALALMLSGAVCAQKAAKPVKAEKSETPHLAFVKEFVRELSAVEEIRAKGEEENKNSPDATFSNIIHTATLFKLELGSQIRMLNGMSLKKPFETVVPTVTDFYAAKIKIWQRMSEIGGEFIGGPKPGVDYPKLGAEMPELRANLEYIDKTIFEMSPMICATLIDMKADSKGHASHLIITKAEKADLLDFLATAFGPGLDEKNPNYTVGTAKIVKDFLNKDFKCADEPWE